MLEKKKKISCLQRKAVWKSVNADPAHTEGARSVVYRQRRENLPIFCPSKERENLVEQNIMLVKWVKESLMADTIKTAASHFFFKRYHALWASRKEFPKWADPVTFHWNWICWHPAFFMFLKTPKDKHILSLQRRRWTIINQFASIFLEACVFSKWNKNLSTSSQRKNVTKQILFS